MQYGFARILLFNFGTRLRLELGGSVQVDCILESSNPLWRRFWHQVRVPTFPHIYLSSSSARSPFHHGKFLQRKRQECRASLKWEHICCNLSISDRVTRGLSRGHPPKDCPSFQTDRLSKTVILSTEHSSVSTSSFYGRVQFFCNCALWLWHLIQSVFHQFTSPKWPNRHFSVGRKGLAHKNLLQKS